MSQAWPGHVAEQARHCCNARPTVSGAVPHVPCRRALRARCCAYHSSLRRIMALPLVVSHPYHDTTQQPSRVPVMIRPFVSRHCPQQPGPRARAAQPCVRADCVASHVSHLVALLWLYRRPCSTMLWPSGRAQASLPALLVTIQCIVS